MKQFCFSIVVSSIQLGGIRTFWSIRLFLIKKIIREDLKQLFGTILILN